MGGHLCAYAHILFAFLEVHGVKIFEGGVQRRRTDRNGYFTVDEGLIHQRAGDFRARGLDSREIVAKVAAGADGWLNKFKEAAIFPKKRSYNGLKTLLNY